MLRVPGYSWRACVPIAHPSYDLIEGLVFLRKRVNYMEGISSWLRMIATSLAKGTVSAEGGAAAFCMRNRSLIYVQRDADTIWWAVWWAAHLFAQTSIKH